MTSAYASPATVSAPNTRCGEGPVWDDRRRVLVFNDMIAERWYAYDPAHDRTACVLEGVPVAASIPHESGGWVLLGAKGVSLYSHDGTITPMLHHHGQEALTFNDAVADGIGRIYAGTCHWRDDGMVEHGRLYLIDNAGRARVVEEGLELSNGVAVSPDGRTLYLADSTARCVYCYDIHPADGGLSGKRIFLSLPPEQGLPDGLTMDADGFLWVAHWYGGRISRVAPDGVVERQILLPARQVSNMAFGGDDLMDLYITTASDPWRSDYVPTHYDDSVPDASGGLFRLRSDAPGRPVSRARLLEKKHEKQ